MPYAERRNRFYFEGRCQGSSEFPAIPDIATDACPQCGQRQDIPHHSHVKEFARRSVAEVSADFTIARSEEHTSELQSLMRISYAVFCLKKKNQHIRQVYTIIIHIQHNN